MKQVRLISQHQKVFSLIVILMGDKNLTKLLEKHIGDYELPSKKTITRWKNYRGIPNLGDTGTNLFYIDSGIEKLVIRLSDEDTVIWKNQIKKFFKEKKMDFDEKIYDLEFQKLKNADLINNFEFLNHINDYSLPFFNTKQQDSFMFYLSILQNLWSNDEYQNCEEKLLKVSTSNKVLFFPSVCLFDKQITFNPFLKYSKKNEKVPDCFISQIKNVRKKIIDNPTFCLKELDASTGEIQCSISSYYKALYDCDLNYYRIITSFQNTDALEFENSCNAHHILKWQENLKKITLENDYTNIEASIGGSCLVVYRDSRKNEYAYLISNKKTEANGVGEKHVTPSFMLQPFATDFLVQHLELDYEKQLFREFLEEVIGHEDFESTSHNEAVYDDIFQNKCIAELQELFKTGKAELHSTGLWLDFYRLRPEVTSLLIIHSQTWSKKYLENNKLGNWETKKGGLLKLYLKDEITYENILKGIPNSMCSPGLSTFIKGRELALKLCRT